MGPKYECLKNCMYAPNQPTIAQDLITILITILSLFGGEIIFEVFQPDGQTDDILWHHLAVKLGRQNVADIIGIADI